MNKLFLTCLFLLGCNNTASVPNRVEVVASGEATVVVTVNLQLIDQLTELCRDQMAPLGFPSELERKKAVADCVFQHMGDLGGDTAALGSFVSTYCGPNADLSKYSAVQQASIRQTCSALSQ